MNTPSSPTSTTESSSDNYNNYNNYTTKYKYYPPRPKNEWDYDPPEFIPPSDDSEEENKNINKNNNKNTNSDTDSDDENENESHLFPYEQYDNNNDENNDENIDDNNDAIETPNMYETVNENINYNNYNNNYINNNKNKYNNYNYNNYYNNNTSDLNINNNKWNYDKYKQKRQRRPPPPMNNNNYYCNRNNTINNTNSKQWKCNMCYALNARDNVVCFKCSPLPLQTKCKKRRTDPPPNPPPNPKSNESNKSSELLRTGPKLGWGAELGNNYKVMLKTVDRLEKRQTKMDKIKIKVNNAKEKLELQHTKCKTKLECDKQIILNEYDKIGIQMTQQYNTLKHNLEQISEFLNEFGNEFGEIHKQVEKCLFVKNSNQKIVKKEAEISIRKFDNKFKTLNIIEPKLKYESCISDRYNEEIKYSENKIIFVDGLISGVVPILPDRIDVTLTKSYTKKEIIIESPSSSPPMSEISLATNAKFNVYNNIRVMIEYMKSVNILQHEIIIELKNTKPFNILIDSNTNFYEWRNVSQDLKVYEGNVKVRSRNNNGWSQYKAVKFKFDEDGNHISDL